MLESFHYCYLETYEFRNSYFSKKIYGVEQFYLSYGRCQNVLDKVFTNW